MTVLGFVATLLGGATLGALAVGFAVSAHRCEESFTCGDCFDTGTVTRVDYPADPSVSLTPRNVKPWPAFCRTCTLGQNLAEQAEQFG